MERAHRYDDERDRDADRRGSRVRCYVCDEEGHYANNCPRRGPGGRFQEMAKRHALKDSDVENLELLIKNFGGIPVALTQVTMAELDEFVKWKKERREKEKQEKLLTVVRLAIESERDKGAKRKRSPSPAEDDSPRKTRQRRGRVARNPKVKKRRAQGRRKKSDSDSEEEERDGEEDIDDTEGGPESREKGDDPKKMTALELHKKLKGMKDSDKKKREVLRTWMDGFDSDDLAVDALEEVLETEINRGGTKGKVAITRVLEDLLRF